MADDKVNEVPTELSFGLPRWATSPLQGLGPLPDADARMALVLRLAEATLTHSSGGPFAAALFTLDDGQLIAAGVNLVLSTGPSPTPRSSPSPGRLPAPHARPRAGGPDRAGHVVRARARCAWGAAVGRREPRGVRRRDGTPRGHGFDEGDKHPDWPDPPPGPGHRGRAGRGPEEAAEIMRATPTAAA
jgi:hypothetical protein